MQLAACCRWFDSKLIRHLVEQHDLDFAAAADDRQNCFGWLTQLSFVEPVGRHWRLDDVARDIFRQSLERDSLERIHASLAQYFQAQSAREVEPQSPPSQTYETPDWLSLRADYLYHLLFTRQDNLQTEFITRLLEARYFRKDDLIRIPFRAIAAEFELSEHPLIRHRTRQFLQRIHPAIEYSWAVLEADSIDYAYNENNLGLSQIATDQAVETCLKDPKQFQGLAQFAALLYKSRRCAEVEKSQWLQQAKNQANPLTAFETPEFMADLWVYKLGNSFHDAGFFEAEIAAYDAALAIKPDKHEALYNKGIALSNLGRYEEAIAAYDIALAIKPDKHEALNNKGIALSNLGRYEEAIAAYDIALAIKPDQHEALNNKACAYGLKCDIENSLKFLQEAIAKDPENRDMAKNDTDFVSIRADERFRALVEGNDQLA
ncbi:MAG: tetratricopeptide repeat protein [Cyanobacteria bacterium P01_A01_bin.123]